MNKLFLMLLTAFICNALEAQTWNELELGTSEDLNKVYFVNDDVGFIIGDHGLLLRTVNGGGSWETITTNVQHDLKTISFANGEVGFINGLKTTDGGTTWIPQASSEIYGFLYAYSENRIMAGHGDAFDGHIYESTDGGASWGSGYNFGGLTMFNDCDFINPNEGYVSSWYAGHLFKTVDAGMNWSEVAIDEVDGNPWTSDDFRSVFFPSQEIGLVTHQSGILKTLDAGNTWSEIKPAGLNSSFYPQSVIARSTGHYILVGSGYNSEFHKIYETLDGGNTWVQSANTIEDVLDVACGSVNCFAVGSNGTVYSKGLTNGISESSGEELISVFPNPSRDVLNIAHENNVSEVRIYGLDGKLHDSFAKTQGVIEISHLDPGIYLIEITFKQGGKTASKFRKE